MIAAALALLCGGSPWAESPLLVAKATDPSFFAVVSMPDLRWRPFEDVRPNSREDRSDPSRSWSWFGRNLPTLDPWDGDSSTRVGVGNEVGDELFREIDAEDPENRTPGIWGFATTPRFGGWRGGALFDQVDHFSDQGLAIRTAALGNPGITTVDPTVRRAYFGENLPDQSFSGAHADFAGPDTRFGVAARSGWIWLASPAGGALECWRATTSEAGLRRGRFAWDQALGWFDRADTANGRIFQIQGRLGADVLRDGEMSPLRAGLWYDHAGRSGNVAWRPDPAWNLGAWLDLDLHAGAWSLYGSNLAGEAFHRLEDTLRWRGRAGDAGLSVLAGGAWSDRPDGLAGYVDSTRAGWARMECGAIEQAYLARTELEWTRGAWTWEASTSPWGIVHPRAFSASGYDSTGGWITRAGAERALPGILWGWKSRAGARFRGSASFAADASIQFDPVLGGPQGGTDLVAPRWGASMGAELSHRSGFSLRPRLLWRSESIVRNRSSEDWKVPSGFDANLWIDQSYFRGRLVFSCAALNILSEDRIEAPNAAEDRFRILVQIAARPWD